MVKVVQYKGFDIKIEYCESPEFHSPADFDNLGTFVHSSYEYSFDSSTDINVRNWSDSEIKELLDNSISVPVYIYDHSGISISTGSFSCPWDSGLFGYYIVSKDKVKKEFGGNRISKKLKNQILKSLENEIVIWNDWVEGNIFKYSIFEDDELLDGCGGYYGDDGIEEAIRQAKDFIDYRTSFKYNDMQYFGQLSIFSEVA